MNPFVGSQSPLGIPYKWIEVTPDDDAELGNFGFAIKVNASDNSTVNVVHPDGSEQDYLLSGPIPFPVGVKGIKATGTALASAQTKVLVAVTVP